jgi:hypothetical protein
MGSLNGRVSSGATGSAQVPNRTASIEELSLNPGTERTIVVWYSPRREPGLSDSKSARLQPRSFRLMLRYRSASGSKLKGKKTIKVASQVCTSLVKVHPYEINLGECNIGLSKSAVVHLTNLSDLPAHISVRYQSKVSNHFALILLFVICYLLFVICYLLFVIYVFFFNFYYYYFIFFYCLFILHLFMCNN